jgi:3-hydroxyacyl-[acyl-carrier-protein] dehydratase
LPAQPPIIDPSTLDFDRPIADIHEIRRYNPQRHEMEQISGILYENLESNVCVGYKDVTMDEFWVRGHMPGMPLMPGVIMLEAAAQLASYFVQKYDMMQAKMIGFGGADEVRFREPVIPGDRLVIALEMIRARPGRMMVCRFEGYVRERLVVEGEIKGIALPVDALGEQLKRVGATPT